MNEKRESIDSEYPGRPGNRRKWLRWGVFLSVLVVVAGAVVVAIVNGYFSDKGQCPKTAPVTEVTKPVSETSEKWLKLVDSGFTPFGNGPVAGATEDLSFGYLLKNTSKYVLYDAHINVSFTDTAGNDPTSLLQKPDRRDNAQVLEDVNIPVIFPGQTVGMGSSITIWSEHGEDPDTGEPTDLEKVDYDKLTLDVEMASGQWWEPKNDKHDFTRVAAKSVNITGSEPADQEHPDGSEWVSADMEYTVDSGACQTLKAYKPSTVVFDDAGRIVGGDISGSKNNDAEGGTYRVDSGDVRHELTESLPEGGRVNVYPYAHPLKPNLD